MALVSSTPWLFPVTALAYIVRSLPLLTSTWGAFLVWNSYQPRQFYQYSAQILWSTVSPPAQLVRSYVQCGQKLVERRSSPSRNVGLESCFEDQIASSQSIFLTARFSSVEIGKSVPECTRPPPKEEAQMPDMRTPQYLVDSPERARCPRQGCRTLRKRKRIGYFGYGLVTTEEDGGTMPRPLDREGACMVFTQFTWKHLYN